MTLIQAWWEILARRSGGNKTYSTGRSSYLEMLDYARACDKQGFAVTVIEHAANGTQTPLERTEWEAK
jgi:hypothetical protein